MTTYYVGIGGSDTADGTTWAKRKVTLNGAEDLPVAAGDTVYVGPGAYREQLALDVSGSATGGPITYIGDVTGDNTDSVGGLVRITGSDNDQTQARGKAIGPSGGNRDYRTFRGFLIDMTNSGTNAGAITIDGGNNWVVEDCVFSENGDHDIYMNGTAHSNNTIRRCIFINSTASNSGDAFINIQGSGGNPNDTSHLIENCYFDGSHSNWCLKSDQCGGITFRNLTVMGGAYGIIAQNNSGGTANIINNCILHGLGVHAAYSDATGRVTEDFNTFFNNGADRNAIATGGSSVSYSPLFHVPFLFDGVISPASPIGYLSEWSNVARITGSSASADDLYGIARPTTASKKGWGAVQLREAERETGTKRTGDASLKLADAGDHAIRMPVDGTEITIEVYVNREANYAGTNPRLIIRQAGQSDDVTTDAGSSGSFNQLTTTLTPAAGWVDVILRSLNTATSGSYAVYFDDLSVS